MKPFDSPSQALDRTTLAFTLLLILSGLFLLLGSHAGLLSLDRIERFWPVSIVAVGLAQLLMWRNGTSS